MNNNDILRRIRYCFDFSDSEMVEIFALANHKVDRDQICNWLKKEDDPEFLPCRDSELAIFLNGLIIEKRGKKEGPEPEPDQVLTNNVVLKKLKIALDLRAEDMLDILALSDMSISKHELSALFRKPGHKHYRECKEQLLRNFLTGVQEKLRGTNEENDLGSK